METCEFCNKEYLIAAIPFSGADEDGKPVYVVWVADPFVAEIYDNWTEHWICDTCYWEHAQDI